jgi:hypothetical protein
MNHTWTNATKNEASSKIHTSVCSKSEIATVCRGFSNAYPSSKVDLETFPGDTVDIDPDLEPRRVPLEKCDLCQPTRPTPNTREQACSNEMSSFARFGGLRLTLTSCG